MLSVRCFGRLVPGSVCEYQSLVLVEGHAAPRQCCTLTHHTPTTNPQHTPSEALAGMKTTEEILVRSEELKASALVFKKNATQLKKLMWWQKTRVRPYVL
jgi:hypothetical protein